MLPHVILKTVLYRRVFYYHFPFIDREPGFKGLQVPPSVQGAQDLNQ